MKQFLTTSIFCIMLAGVSMTAHAQKGTKLFEFDDFLKNYSFYSPLETLGESMKDGEHYTEMDNGSIKKYSYANSKEVETLFEWEKVKTEGLKPFTNYTFSADESKILFYTNRQAIYRRSFTADYYVYDRVKGSLTRLSENGAQQLATFSPDGQKVAFVRKNNLFYTDLTSGKEIQITTDGKFNYVLNGAPDWVYEEEFEYNQAFEWSPDSKVLAWVRFDESKVPEFGMNLFQGAAPPKNEYKLYPGNYVFKYPKAGEPNSVVSIHTYNLENTAVQKMDIGSETDIYIPRIRWSKMPNTLAIFRLNRLQNHFELLFANAQNGSSQVVYSEQNKYYIDEDMFDNIYFLEDGNQLIYRSEKSGFEQIYLYNFKNKQETQLTTGNVDVMDFYGFNEKQKTIYYSTAEPKPYQREIWMASWDGKKKTKLSQITGMNMALFSEGYKYCILVGSNSNTPPVSKLLDAKGKEIRVIDDNKALREKLSGYKFNTPEFFSFKTGEDVELYGWMLKPNDFDPAKKYPVFMTQYSGPNSQSARDSWSLSWENYLAQSGYLVVCVDGRGTGARGEAFRKSTYMQLGKYETIDQIQTAKYLGSLPYVDANRIGIWGWSFGGFISANCMVKGEGVFKAGIAVAPVTNWRYYDNIYTERFMRTPQENPKGYDDNSPLFFAKDLKGSLLLCHGLADDNVHVQNTYEFSERLVQANKQFDMQIYTNRNHNIVGGNTRYHLYTKMTNFILDKL